MRSLRCQLSMHSIMVSVSIYDAVGVEAGLIISGTSRAHHVDSEPPQGSGLQVGGRKQRMGSGADSWIFIPITPIIMFVDRLFLNGPI